MSRIVAFSRRVARDGSVAGMSPTKGHDRNLCSQLA
jgi:hypothetical protein